MVTDKEEERRLTSLVRLIEGLDGFRSGSLMSVTRLKSYYDHSKPRYLKRRWRDIEKDLRGILGLASKRPELKRALSYNRRAEGLYRFSLMATFAALTLLFLVKEPLVFLIIFAVLMVVSNVALALKLYAYRKVSSFYAKGGDLYKEEAERLKTDVEQLLSELKVRLKRAKADPGRYKLRLRNSDYKDIMVVKEGRGGLTAVIDLGAS